MSQNTSNSYRKTRKKPSHLLVRKPHDMIPTNFRCYGVFSHTLNVLRCVLPLIYLHFCQSNSLKLGSPDGNFPQQSFHQVEVFVLDVDRTLPDRFGGGPTRGKPGIRGCGGPLVGLRIEHTNGLEIEH